MSDTLVTLENGLRQYGWKYERVADDTLLTGFESSDSRLYPITITISEDAVTFTTAFEMDQLFVDSKVLWSLLELNAIVPWAKVAVDAESHLLLAVDCPPEAISSPVLARALDIISDVAQMIVTQYAGLVK